MIASPITKIEIFLTAPIGSRFLTGIITNGLVPAANSLCDLLSPKERAKASYAQQRSKYLALYSNAEMHDSLAGLTKEIQSYAPPPKLSTPYVGTFSLFGHNVYRAIWRGTQSFKMICTYVITNKMTGSVYVGSTNDFWRRWQKHCNLLKANGHTNIRLQEEFDAFGSDVFTMEVVECFESTEGLLAQEERVAQAYKPELLLNFRIGTKFANGWHVKQNFGRGRAGRPPKTTRGPQSKPRWFDYASA